MTKLIPGTSSQLKFRRSEDIFISSNIEFNCNQSFSISTKWIIYSCLLNCSSKTLLDLPEIETTYGELFIPSLMLSYGLYEFELTVSVSISSNLIESKSLFVQIISSDIEPNLIPYETSIITIGYEQDLKLDPGSFSIDPDQYSFDRNVS
jgi:hypothetical protein